MNRRMEADITNVGVGVNSFEEVNRLNFKRILKESKEDNWESLKQ